MAAPNGTLPPVPPLTREGFADPTWQRWLTLLRARIVAAATALSVQSANGFSGNVAVDGTGATVITLSITPSGVLKGTGGAIAAAVAGTDFIQGITATAPLSQTGGATPNVSMTQAGAAGNGWLSSTDWNTFNSKIAGNQPITLTGDATGTGTTSIAVTFAASGVAAGTYTKVTVDTKGRVTNGTALASGDVTTALGYTPLNPANNLSDVSNIATARTNLGYGTIATQNANAVAITGGSITLTGALTPSQTVGIVGTNTNNSANAGSVGEFTTLAPAAIALTSGVSANVVAMNLTAGDWDVQGVMALQPAAATVTSQCYAGVSQAGGTLGALGQYVEQTVAVPAGAGTVVATPIVRFTFAATTTIYLVTNSSFSGGTMNAQGVLRARRVR